MKIFIKSRSTKDQDSKLHQSVCLYSSTHFTHERGQEMHVKSLSQGLNVDLAQPGLKPGTS